MTPELDVAVVGGGISGLSAAFSLASQRPELEIALVEASPRLGGCVRTERSDGYVIEAGPDSFLRTKPDAVALCAELGMKSELIEVLRSLIEHGADIEEVRRERPTLERTFLDLVADAT